MGTYCVSCILTPEERDVAMAVWYALGMEGSEEESVEDGVRIKVYFKDLEAAQSAAEDLEKRNPRSPVLICEIENQDWNKQWRESMKPAKLAPGFWVSPLWLPPPLHSGENWIKIEPKMAFGTGHHETTRLAAQAILAHRKWLEKRSILDIGTGSGILCFVTDLCGAALSIGTEIDPDCRENLAENRMHNTSSGKIEFIIGPLDSLKTITRFDLIVMNMITTESDPLLPQVAKMLKRDGILIRSGILFEEKDAAIETARSISCELIMEKTEHEWWCGTFHKL